MSLVEGGEGVTYKWSLMDQWSLKNVVIIFFK